MKTSFGLLFTPLVVIACLVASSLLAVAAGPEGYPVVQDEPRLKQEEGQPVSTPEPTPETGEPCPEAEPLHWLILPELPSADCPPEVSPSVVQCHWEEELRLTNARIMGHLNRLKASGEIVDFRLRDWANCFLVTASSEAVPLLSQLPEIAMVTLDTAESRLQAQERFLSSQPLPGGEVCQSIQAAINEKGAN